jgi:hypothetical protein
MRKKSRDIELITEKYEEMAQQLVVKKTFSDPWQISVFFFNCHVTLTFNFFG